MRSEFAIPWRSLCASLRETFHNIASHTALMTDKDRNGFTVSAWERDERSGNFVYTGVLV